MVRTPYDEATSRLSEAEYQLLHLANQEKDDLRKRHFNDIATDIRKARQRVEELPRPDGEQLTYSEDTLNKVHRALSDSGLTRQDAIDVVNAMLNRGILFRERLAS